MATSVPIEDDGSRRSNSLIFDQNLATGDGAIVMASLAQRQLFFVRAYVTRCITRMGKNGQIPDYS